MKKLLAGILTAGVLMGELLSPITTYAAEVSETEEIVSEAVTTEETASDETATDETTEAVSGEATEEASEAVSEETTEESSEAVSEETTEESSEAVSEETVEETEAAESAEESSEAVSEETAEDSTVVSEETTEETTEASEEDVVVEEEDITYEKDETSVEYVVVLNPEVAQNEEQYVLIGFDVNKAYEAPVLNLVNKDTKVAYQLENPTITDQGMAFKGSFLESGNYELVSLQYKETVNDVTTYYEANFKDLGITSGFGVGEDSNYTADETVATEDSESLSEEDAEFVVTDMTGDDTSVSDVSEALEQADKDVTGTTVSETETKKLITKLTGGITAKAAGNAVVVLDPGHGGSDSGAVGNGLKEKDLTLKIATYCKEALAAYSGITVYMTRTDDTYVSLSDRVAYAKSVNANYFVSIHINSGGATGAEVWYPNSNYKASIGSSGKALAQSIEDQLVALGLTNRGIKTRNSENGSTYPDGSSRDYYAVIAGSKEQGFPGIIVEHGFIDSSDAANYFSSDEKLKALGVADAKGIAEYLQASAQTLNITAEINTIKTVDTFNGVYLDWTLVDGATGYYVYRRSTTEDWTLVADTALNYFVDYTGQCNTTYAYCLIPYNEYGSGVVGTAKTVTTGKATLKSLTVKNASFNGVTLKWSKVEGATNYMVYRKTSGSAWTLVAVTGAVTKYTDTTGNCGKKYQYCVRGARVWGSSVVLGDDSPKQKITTSYSNTYIKKVVGKSFGRAKITWAKVKGATGYRVYRKEKGGSWEKLNFSTTKTSFTDTTANCNTTYYYAVRPYRAVGSLVIWSQKKSGKVKFTTGNLTVKLKSATALTNFNQVKVKWKGVEGVTYYQVERCKKGTKKWSKTWEIAGTGITGTTFIDTTAECASTYKYRVYAIRYSGDTTVLSNPSNESSAVTTGEGIVNMIAAVTIEGGIRSAWYPIAGVDGYEVLKRITGTTIWTVAGYTQLNYYDDFAVESGGTYEYAVRGYKLGTTTIVYSSDVSPTAVGATATTAYSILGASSVNVAQMVKLYTEQGVTYPSSVYASKGAATVTDFANIVYNVSNAYGVKAEVVWAQICLETGYLQFGGDVKAEQCNFCGLGATGNGVSGATFSSVTEGVTAQVQHLKKYASTDTSWASTVEIVDPRFDKIKAGTTPYVEYLSIPNNPNNTGWATDPQYAEKLLKLIWTMRNYT